MTPPASLVQPCPHPYPRKIYPDQFEVRRVRTNGQFKWKRKMLFLSLTLIHEDAGIELVDGGLWDVCFGKQR